MNVNRFSISFIFSFNAAVVIWQHIATLCLLRPFYVLFNNRKTSSDHSHAAREWDSSCSCWREADYVQSLAKRETDFIGWNHYRADAAADALSVDFPANRYAFFDGYIARLVSVIRNRHLHYLLCTVC